MKNTLLILPLGILVSAVAMLTACSNDDDASDDSPAGSTWTLTVKATKGGNEADTRALSLSNDILYATWATTENVYVYYDKEEHGVLHPKANDYWAMLSGNLTDFSNAFITNSIEGGGFNIRLQFPRKNPITWEGQLGTLDDIAQNFDWATATVKVTAVTLVDDKNKILTATHAYFENLQAIVKFTLLQNDGTALPSNPTAFTVSDGGDYPVTLTIPSGTYTTNGNGVLYVAIPGFENKTVTLTATVGSDTYTYTTKTLKTFENGKFYDITVKMTKLAN